VQQPVIHSLSRLLKYRGVKGRPEIGVKQTRLRQ